MSELSELHPELVPANLPAAGVWAKRLGTRHYLAGNENGVSVEVGGEGNFTPGELMKIALLTCQTLSADHRIARELGQDGQLTAVATAVKNDAEERYESFVVDIDAALAGLDEDQLAKLRERVDVAINRYCTVGHTVEHGAHVTTRLNGTPIA